MLLAACLPLLCFRAAAADPVERRIALVIGNNNYLHVGSLATAGNDAHAMAKELRVHGFAVLEGYDLDRSPMLHLINEFTAALPHYDVGLFYYAGHGVQMHGANWLIPHSISGDFQREDDLADESVGLADVAERMATANHEGFNLLIIDACRDNPFATRQRGFGAVRGLGVTAANGVVILYSAGSNQTALDNLGPSDHDPNGVFTRELLKQMRVPGLPVSEMIDRLRSLVRASAATVHHEQMPAIYAEATGHFMFTPPDGSQAGPPAGAPVVIAPAPTPPPPRIATADDAARAQRPPQRPLPVVPRPVPLPYAAHPSANAPHNPNDICTSLGTC
jgi:uncharacterized caspase-like protein